MIEFREPLAGDIEAIAPRLRDIDRRECAAWGRSPHDALDLGLRAGGHVWTGLVDGRPEAMFGVTPKSLLDRLGIPWMLQTDAVPPRALLELSREWLARMEALYPRLENWIAADNRQSIRWLRWLGFTVDAALTDIGGEPMRRFHKGL